MTLERLIKLFGQRMAELLEDKMTGQVAFTVNLSQGGIGSCKFRIEKAIK